MQPKRLMRSRNKILGGVCGGLAEYFDIDPSVVRLVALGLVLLTHVMFAIPAYLVMWALVPQAAAAPNQQ
jgi:phage shock protein C